MVYSYICYAPCMQVSHGETTIIKYHKILAYLEICGVRIRNKTSMY